MSNWEPKIVKLGKIEKHPNADTLQISTVLEDNTVIFKENQYKEGDLVSYIPYDTVCSDHPDFAFLGEKKRIKPMRLRGVFSEGILVPAPIDFVEGASVVEYYGLSKYEYEEEEAARIEADAENTPGHFHIPYYDLENLRKYLSCFVDGEEVLISEKLEGENYSILHDGERLWVRSRNLFKKEEPESHWWKTALELGLKEKLVAFPMLAIQGELYGGVKHFLYDCPIVDKKAQRKFRVFDVYSSEKRKYLEWSEVEEICGKLSLETVPELYRGPWKADKSLYTLAEGQSTIGSCLREGFVMRSVPNSFNPYLNGRKIVKLKSEGYQIFKAKKT